VKGRTVIADHLWCALTGEKPKNRGGRPRLKLDPAQVEKLYQETHSLRRVAKIVNASHKTVLRVLRARQRRS